MLIRNMMVAMMVAVFVALFSAPAAYAKDGVLTLEDILFDDEITPPENVMSMGGGPRRRVCREIGCNPYGWTPVCRDLALSICKSSRNCWNQDIKINTPGGIFRIQCNCPATNPNLPISPTNPVNYERCTIEGPPVVVPGGPNTTNPSGPTTPSQPANPSTRDKLCKCTYSPDPEFCGPAVRLPENPPSMTNSKEECQRFQNLRNTPGNPNYRSGWKLSCTWNGEALPPSPRPRGAGDATAHGECNTKATSTESIDGVF